MFSKLCSVIGLEKLALSSQPIRCKFQINRDLTTRVSCASSSLLEFTLSSYWLMTMETFVLIGHWDIFDFIVSTFSLFISQYIFGKSLKSDH